MTGTNCLGRLSPVIARVMDCNRVPSPPASITAHRFLIFVASFVGVRQALMSRATKKILTKVLATKRHKKHKNGRRQWRPLLCRILGGKLFLKMVEAFEKVFAPTFRQGFSRDRTSREIDVVLFSAIQSRDVHDLYSGNVLRD